MQTHYQYIKETKQSQIKKKTPRQEKTETKRNNLKMYVYIKDTSLNAAQTL